MSAQGRNRSIRITRSSSALASRVVETSEDDADSQGKAKTPDSKSDSAREISTSTSMSALSTPSGRTTSVSPFKKTLVAEYGSDDEDSGTERTDRTKNEKITVYKKLASNDLRNFIPSGNKRKESLTSLPSTSDARQSDNAKQELDKSQDNENSYETDDTMSIHAEDDSFFNDAGEKETHRSASNKTKSIMTSNAKKRKITTELPEKSNTLGEKTVGSVPNSNKSKPQGVRRKSQGMHPGRLNQPKALRPLPSRAENNRPGLLGEAPSNNNKLHMLLSNLLQFQGLPVASPPMAVTEKLLSPVDIMTGLSGKQQQQQQGIKQKRAVCKFILQALPCRYGDSCHFYHPATEAKNAQLGGNDGIWKAPAMITPVQRKRPAAQTPPDRLTVLSNLRNQFDVFLKNKNIVEAWTVLRQALVISPEDVKINFLEKLLITCSQTATRETVDTCMEVFEAIGKHRQLYVLEDFDCLIKCFCRATQYESALQAAVHMKKTNFHVSKELLDLIPYKALGNIVSILEFWPEMKMHWLKDARFLNHLLESVEDMDLILEYVTANEWWIAYEKLGKVFNDLHADCQGKFLHLLMNIPEKESFIDLLDRIDFADVIPLSVIQSIIEGASSPKTVMLIIKLTPKLPTDVVERIDSQVWNRLLIKCCDGNLEHAMFAQQIHAIMGRLNVALTLEGATHLLLLLCKTKLYTSLCDFLPEIQFDMSEFPSDLIKHISILLRNFEPTEAEEKQKHMVALMKIGEPVPDAVLETVVKMLMEKKEFIAAADILKQFQSRSSSSQPSYVLLTYVLKILELKCEDIQLSIDVYTIIRKMYPRMTTLSSHEVSTDTTGLIHEDVRTTPVHVPPPPQKHVSPQLKPQPPVKEAERPRLPYKSVNLCRFASAGMVCRFADNCRFSHDIPSAKRDNAMPPPVESRLSHSVEQRQSHATESHSSHPIEPRQSYPVESRQPNPTESRQPHAAESRPTYPIEPRQVYPVNASSSSVDDVATVSSPKLGEASGKRSLSVSSKMPVALKDDKPVESSKEQLEYISAIKRCGYESPLEDLARIHLRMRFNGVQILNSNVIKAFVFALSYMQKLGDNFELYLSTLNYALSNMTPSRRNPSELELDSVLDGADLIVVGHIGILLMQYCYLHKKSHDGYRILHSLHAHEVNYCELGREYKTSVQTLSHCDIAVIATSICISVVPSQLVGAMEVLRGANYALPIDGHELTTAESADRHDVIQKLVRLLLQNNMCDEAYEVLQKSGGSSGSFADFDIFYNTLLSRFSDREDIQKAIDTYRYMEKNSVSIENDSFKSLINGLAGNSRMAYARQLYNIASDKHVYESSYSDSDPLLINVSGPQTKVELLFLIERHLNLLRNHHLYGEHSFHGASWQANRGTMLRIAFKAGFPALKENLLEVLSADLNPPLTITGVDLQQITADMMSVKRWYLAVPPASRLPASPSSSLPTIPSSAMNGGSDYNKTTVSSSSTPAIPSNAAVGISSSLSSSPSFSGHYAQSGATLGYERSSRSQTAHQPITLAIANRITYYVKIGKVEPEGFQELCKMLTRYFMRSEQNCNPEFIFSPMVEERANIFVDNFFKKHKTFKK